MKAVVHCTEPTLLRDAKRGDLFILQNSVNLCEVVYCVSSIVSEPGDASSIAIVSVASRVDSDEPGYFPPGTLMYVSASTPIAFIEQITPATFRERDRPLTLEQRKALAQRLTELQAQYLPM